MSDYSPCEAAAIRARNAVRLAGLMPVRASTWAMTAASLDSLPALGHEGQGSAVIQLGVGLSDRRRAVSEHNPRYLDFLTFLIAVAALCLRR